MQPDPVEAAAALTYVMDTAPVLALRLDADQCVVSANAQALRVLGPEAVGRRLADLAVDFTRAPDCGHDGIQLLSLRTTSGLPESYYFRCFALADGTLALGSLDYSEQVHLRTEVLGLNRELNDLTRQLHLANAELRELNELKNRFIGMAAHDLRKPIGVIMTYLDFVLDEAGDRLADEQRGFLRTSLAAAAGMKRLIDTFLDVSVIESGHLRLERARTDVSEILAGALPLVRLVAAKKKVELITATEADVRPLAVDGAKLQQVLVNLVGNAVEHSTAGQRVWIGACRKDAELVFSVRDEGAGIAPEAQRRLFAPFARAGTRKTAGERSVGLGLAIARQVVDAHGGRIWVESEAGHGSTFFVGVPVPNDSGGET